MADKGAKTEQPTQRRIEKSRKEGQFASAREFVSALQFLVFLGLLSAGGGSWFAAFRSTMRALLVSAFRPTLTPEDLTQMAWQVARRHVLPLVLAGMAIAGATVGLRLLTTRGGISFKKLAPDAQRFDPLSRLRELPRQNLPNLAQALLLIPIFLWAVYALARDKLETLLTLPLRGIDAGIAFLATSLMDLFWKAAAVFVVFGCVDLFRQMQRHNADLRMTKQEIREEMKEVEGNPQMKARIRRIQRDRARKQMMKEIPRATAVVVNPTHFAVAIRYDMDGMTAPVVVAKGKNYLALRIKQKAIDHQVPIVENPPLAQALYKSVDVGQEIPPHLYRAVAEILAYIYKLMNGRLPG
ncbi:MAG: EscU/YscU/HrcU family type III secretion system export apparatus switch protein [Acidobacteriota bacterium]|nr:EscU/YscU/HrcU family type III secretion system export apparatus switch protein [Acidobacteriota bacterium]